MGDGKRIPVHASDTNDQAPNAGNLRSKTSTRGPEEAVRMVHLAELEVQNDALRHALEGALDRYRLLYDFAPVGHMSLDRNGYILKSNLAIKGLFGIAQPQKKLSFTRYVANEDRFQFATFLKEVFSRPTGKISCELKLLNERRDPIVAQIVAQVIESGQQCLVAVIDITELRQEEQRFHIMAENTYAWEFWLGPDNKFIYMSPSCQRITGYEAADFMADPELFYRIIHPEDRPSLDLFNRQSPQVNFEYRIIDRSGSVRWIRLDSQNITTANGTNMGLRGSNLDVTSERQLKQKLVHSVEELKKLTTELNLSEERERRRIALALHDQVVQCMAISNLNLDAALQRGEITDHPVLRELKSLLESWMHDLRDLSLDLSSPILYDIGIRAAIANLGEKLGEKFGFVFVFEVEGTPEATLSEDLAISVFQFCRELLINAGKHSGASTVHVFLYLKDDQLIMSIQDDGNGFDLTDSKAGFGLVNIRQRVNNLKGKFRIQSEIDKGTSAEIYLCTKSSQMERSDDY